jgi:alpha-tubulin suppressor-like RCC1 family protein
VSNQVYCWGSNAHGQLGTGDDKNRGDKKNPQLSPVSLGL